MPTPITHLCFAFAFTRNESSREHSLLGAKVPTGNFRSEERKYRGAKSPDTYFAPQAVTVTEQPGSWLDIHLVKTEGCALYVSNKPGFGIGFGGAGRVGTAVIIYSYTVN